MADAQSKRTMLAGLGAAKPRLVPLGCARDRLLDDEREGADAALVAQPTRREVLGAAVGLPVFLSVGGEVGPLHRASRGPPPRPGEDIRWARLIAALSVAEGALRGAERAMRGLPFAEAEALQDAYDARVEAFEGALVRLLRAPAPDVAAFAAKVVLAIDHDVATWSGGEACLKAVRRDAIRFGQSGT